MSALRSLLILPVLALSACATATTQSGVGFDDGYGAYRTSREAELRGSGGPVLVAPGEPNVITGDDLAAAGIGGGSTAGMGSSPAAGGSTFDAGGGFATTGAPPPARVTPGGSVGISDEQDFGAVSSRETIESDAERLAAQRQAYEVIPPEPLPERPRDTGPNIVQFALSTTNQPGEQIYNRTNILAESRFNRNCGRYATSDQAQQAFLEAGGPRRDRMGLDPDGDGFACYWDPRPFRAARGG